MPRCIKCMLRRYRCWKLFVDFIMGVCFNDPVMSSDVTVGFFAPVSLYLVLQMYIKSLNFDVGV